MAEAEQIDKCVSENIEAAVNDNESQCIMENNCNLDAVGRTSNSESISSVRSAPLPNRSDTMIVHLTTTCGTRIEMYNVPRKFYASEIGVLVMRDTGLEHGSFRIYHGDTLVKPLTQLEAYLNRSGVVELTMHILDIKDNAKVVLGEREVSFKSGLTVRIICRKAFVPEDPCVPEDVLRIRSRKEAVDGKTNVTIQWLPPDHHKAFIGGYRHVITNARYHHAWAQTLPSKPSGPIEPQIPNFSRETQTYRMKHAGQTTLNHMSTQFPKPGYFVSNAKDQTRIPGPYETADEYLERKLQNIIIIQKYIRRWLAKRRVDKMRQLQDELSEWEKQHRAKIEEEKEKQKKLDYERRLHPRTQADFDRLFNALEDWRQEKVAEIDSKQYSTAERKAKLALLLDEEAELITAIGRHQLCVSQVSNDRARLKLLKKAAAPIRWISAINGRPLEVETPETQRGKELLDIFISLGLDKLTAEERLDLLLTTKRTIKQYDLRLCRELIKLIDREAELIMMGVKDIHLKGLRRRILNQFVKFCEIPEVNPEIAHYLKVPTGSKEKLSESLKGDVYHCIACDRYLRGDAYPLSTRTNRLAPCAACRRLDNRARKRLDFNQYQRILRQLQEQEVELVEQTKLESQQRSKEAELERLERLQSPEPDAVIRLDGTDFRVLNCNPFPFLMDAQDIQFLVDDVWERRSVLSGWLEITDLVLTRWRIHEPWSPWNTILVTRGEAEAHRNLGTYPLEQAYADAMLNMVNQRLVMGKNAFARLLRNGIEMAYNQVLLAQRMQKPEPTQEWLQQKRERLPPLVKFHSLMHTSEKRHEATYQPPSHLLPAIRGEKELKEVEPNDQSILTRYP